MTRRGGDEVVELAGELSAQQTSELEGSEENPWDSDGTLRWRDKDLYLAVRDADGRLVAVAGLVVAAVSVDSGPAFEVAGVGGVIVRADRRGEGLARQVVTAALARAGSLGPARAMLFCWGDRAGLYERLGFQAIPGPVTVGQPGGASAPMHMESMWRPLRDGVGWPGGDVTLSGLPF